MSETDMRQHRCCFTGHRDIPAQEEATVRSKIRKQVLDLLEKGYNTFLVGGARGFDMLAALLLGVSGDGVYVIREMCVPNLTLGEAALRIAETFGRYRPQYAVASPDLWNRWQDSGRSGFEIMQGVSGMPSMIPADDRRIPGWRVLKDYLAGGRQYFIIIFVMPLLELDFILPLAVVTLEPACAAADDRILYA